MGQTKTWKGMSPELMRVADRASRDKSSAIRSLAHLIDEEALKRAFKRLRKDAAVGSDGVTCAKYEENLDENIQNLVGRMKSRQYRHQPIRRVMIPKENGSKRPLGISTTEDKVVQEALRETLSAIYEQDFYECSYGFRPGRGAHDAIKALNCAIREGRANWIIDADIRSFFDMVSHQHLREFLRRRVSDRGFEGLIAKCLKVGVLEGESLTESTEGTPQGSVLSPLLANIYLHYVLDEWFETVVKKHLSGAAELVRYADDFVICFESEEDARRVMSVLPKRMEKYGLSLHPEKTHLLDFRNPRNRMEVNEPSGSFDFPGFHSVLAKGAFSQEQVESVVYDPPIPI